VTDFLNLTARSSKASSNSPSLAEKLAKLHTTPAPAPDGHSEAMFGFPVTTCCGDTPQDNTFERSWADFFSNRRLRFILARSETRNGADLQLRKLVEATISEIVPRLLGERHLNDGKGVTPVVVHGDLWSGNTGRGTMGTDTTVQEVVYDPSAFYGHSEYDLGIMKMFGGFGGTLLEEYHQLCPKTEPVSEYKDRVALYKLYHQLNHHALFGGGYRSSAMGTMHSLLNKYGQSSERI